MVAMRFVSVGAGLGLVFLGSKFSTVAELAIYSLGFAFVVDLFLDLLIADLKKMRKIQRLRRQSQSDRRLQDDTDGLNEGAGKHEF